MTEWPNEENILQGGYQNTLRIFTKGDNIWKSIIFEANVAYL